MAHHKSLVPEELSNRQPLMMLLAEEGWGRLENQTKTNDQLFSEYYHLIASTHTPRSLYEASWLLGIFKTFLG